MRSFSPGIGATEELGLRVSVAALVRVLFKDPRNGEWILALERKATLRDNGDQLDVDIKSQPFGGALRLVDLNALRDVIGDFHFDSEYSRSERDFRIFIRPSMWDTLQTFCFTNFNQNSDTVLEADPNRELFEELDETLGISIEPDQYRSEFVETIIEDIPSPTENFYATGSLTARLYRIFEAHILDDSLMYAMLANSERCSNQDLRELTLKDYQNGGPGWANAILTLPLKQISAFYLTIPSERRNRSIRFQNHELDETVAAVLEGVDVPKYRRV